ncbi:putative cobalamin (vitamin B12) biosynthesis CobW-like, cobW-like domain superfamily [Helianthus anomalus]
MAQIKQAKFGVVDMDFVLGVGGYDLDRIDSEDPLEDSHCENHTHEHGHECHQGHHHDHKHDSAVSSLDDWLERLVEEKGDDLYRMKGVLSVSDSETRYVIQVLSLFIFNFSYFTYMCSLTINLEVVMFDSLGCAFDTRPKPWGLHLCLFHCVC